MDYIAIEFLFVFIPLFAILFALSPQRLRPILVLISSAVLFYWAHPFFLILIFALTLINYVLALALDRFKARALILLFVGLAINLGVLIFHKYFTTYPLDNLPAAWEKIIPDIVETQLQGILYPIGLSYISFQLISYIVDVFRGRIPVERNLFEFTIYVLYFPKMITGPIVRYSAFAQECAHLTFSFENAAQGLRRFVTGLSKKVIIADQLARVTNAAFDLKHPTFDTPTAWFVLIAYALQIYFDFSGYADMALGLAQTMGIKLPENFNHPYLASSIGDFWRRWHITLSMWFREYVFYPLERKRLSFAGQQINVLIVFLLTGLWHGLTLPFAIWGLIHGMALALESTSFGRWMRSLWKPIQHAYALIVILAAWIFFRSNTPLFAIQMIGRLIGLQYGIAFQPFSVTKPLPLIDPTVWIAFGLGLILILPFDQLRKWIALDPLIFTFVMDVFIVVAFWASVAALLGGGFAPGIYAGF